MTVVLECDFDPPHQHSWPDDWEFGGARGLDPRADVRYRPTTYYYLSDHLDVIWTTQVPLCDDEALDNFSLHSDAVYIQVKRPGMTSPELMDFTYDRATDTVNPLGA